MDKERRNSTKMVAMDLETYIEKKNHDAFTDFMIKGLFGSFFSFFVYGLIYMLVWSVSTTYASWFAMTYIILGVGSSWRIVNPLRGLPALSDEENAQREIAGWVEENFSGIHKAPEPPSFVTTLKFFLRGPRNVLEAVQSWKLRIPVDSTVIKEAQDILNQGPDGSVVTGQHQAVWLLGYLNLATVKPSESDNKYEIAPTPRGQTLSQYQEGSS